MFAVQQRLESQRALRVLAADLRARRARGGILAAADVSLSGGSEGLPIDALARPIPIPVAHVGSGKTEIPVNLAPGSRSRRGEATLVGLDLVEP